MNAERVLLHADWSGRVQHVNNTHDVTETREYLIMGINALIFVKVNFQVINQVAR